MKNRNMKKWESVHFWTFWTPQGHTTQIKATVSMTKNIWFPNASTIFLRP